MKQKFSWQFKLFVLYAIVGVVVAYGCFGILIQTDDIMFTIPVIIGLAMLVSAIKIIDIIPIFVEGENE